MITLKTLRKEAGLSFKTLAYRANVSIWWLQKAERLCDSAPSDPGSWREWETSTLGPLLRVLDALSVELGGRRLEVSDAFPWAHGDASRPVQEGPRALRDYRHPLRQAPLEDTEAPSTGD